MECETHKLILLKDLWNLEYSKKSKDNSLSTVVEMLQKTYSKYLHIYLCYVLLEVNGQKSSSTATCGLSWLKLTYLPNNLIQ